MDAMSRAGYREREKAISVADKLNFAALVAPGILLGKDGCLMTGWRYVPPDEVSLTPGDRNYMTERANAALARFGAGWTTWHEAVRLPLNAYPAPEESHFPDPVSRAIDDERRRQFVAEGAHFETLHVMIAMYLPPLRAKSKLVDIVFDDEGTEQKSLGDRLLAGFQVALGEVENALSDIVQIDRFGAWETDDAFGHHDRDDMLTFLQVALTGRQSVIDVPACAMYLDSVLGGRNLVKGTTPRYGNDFISVVSIEGFPSQSLPGILDALNSLAMPYRWSTRMIYLDPHQAQATIGRYEAKWGQKARGLVSEALGVDNNKPDRDALMMVEEASDAKSLAGSDLVKYGYYTSVVVLMREDRAILEADASLVQKVIERAGFVARIETVNTLDAWFGSIPGHARENVVRPLMHTVNLAHLMPSTAEWPGLEHNPSKFFPPNSPPLFYGQTRSTTPFRGNIHVDDVGHVLGFGPTGSGKSTLLAFLAAQYLRYPNATVICFDKGRSIRVLCEAVGGQFYDIGVSDDSPGFAPLSHIDEPGEINWAEDWLATCYQLCANGPMTPAQRGEVGKALQRMQTEDKDRRTITDFLATVQDRDVQDVLSYYQMNTPRGLLLDSKADGISDARFVTFEVEEFLGAGEQIVIPTLLYLFRRIQKRLKGQPAILILDEAWVMLMKPMFRDKLIEWLRTFRRANCAVVLFTQSLDDAYSSGVFPILRENCPTTLLLPNPNAMDVGQAGAPGPADYYKALGLNEAEMQLLKDARRKCDYYYISPLGRRLFELELGPLALSFFAASGKQDLAEQARLKSEHGDGWVAKWLEMRGVQHDIAFQAV